MSALMICAGPPNGHKIRGVFAHLTKVLHGYVHSKKKM